MLKSVRFAFAAAVAWLIFSTVLMVLPGSTLPHQSWLGEYRIDKWVHIALFAILVILWARVVWKKNPINNKAMTSFILLGVAALGYGFVMELVQRYFVFQRSYDNRDIFADGVGCAIGVLFSILRYTKK